MESYENWLREKIRRSNLSKSAWKRVINEKDYHYIIDEEFSKKKSVGVRGYKR